MQNNEEEITLLLNQLDEEENIKRRKEITSRLLFLQKKRKTIEASTETGSIFVDCIISDFKKNHPDWQSSDVEHIKKHPWAAIGYYC